MSALCDPICCPAPTVPSPTMTPITTNSPTATTTSPKTTSTPSTSVPVLSLNGTLSQPQLARLFNSNHADNNLAYYVVDLARIEQQHARFLELLPRVEPFYAVKCNPDIEILRVLARLGTGFDCASQAEIELVQSNFGIDGSRIIFANPCKPASHVRHARAHDVAMMTFDNEDELDKIKQLYPDAQLVLRVLTDDSSAVCKLAAKFGASPERVPMLLAHARALELNVVGVSFHVGSGCLDANAFADAVVVARHAMDAGRAYGFEMNLLDVGGGFPGTDDDVHSPVTFPLIASVLSAALDEHFPEDAFPGLRIIAEPGRFYVSSSHTLSVCIISRRRNWSPDAPPPAAPSSIMYYVNDGVYGSMNCVLYDHAVLEPAPLFPTTSDSRLPSSVWGPTCDGLDCITKTAVLPELTTGDWMVLENMGAYTRAAGCTFNGMPLPSVYYVRTELECN